MKTYQEIFDIVYKHLLTQNVKSQGKYNDCRYRGDNGLKCALGILIPDSKYEPKYETKLVRTLVENNIIEDVSLASVAFLYSLQKIHDDVAVTAWPFELKRLANQYNLTIPTII